MSRRLRFLLPFVLLAASMPPPAQAQSPVPDLEKEIQQHAVAIESKLIAWRRDIHEHPDNRKRARPRSSPPTSPASALK